jgi:hypothetical protein
VVQGESGVTRQLQGERGVTQGESGVARQLQWAATVGDSLEAPAGAVQGEREVMRRRALGKFRWSVRPPPLPKAN